jgi:hypothetical protein
MAAAWNGLFDERGNIGASAVPADSSTLPSAPMAAIAPRWRDSTKPERITSASTGFVAPPSATLLFVALLFGTLLFGTLPGLAERALSAVIGHP